MRWTQKNGNFPLPIAKHNHCNGQVQFSQVPGTTYYFCYPNQQYFREEKLENSGVQRVVRQEMYFLAFERSELARK